MTVFIRGDDLAKVPGVSRVVEGLHVTDGAGVHLNRIIGQRMLDDIDPFVLLDEFRSDDPHDYIAGFPWHPHRGIETITYMVEGSFEHEDSRGGGGIMAAGDVQWMTAGRGILHQEMPAMRDGQLWGYQLWLTLARNDKMVPPRYQHLAADDMPVVERDGARIKIIAGALDDTKGPADVYYPIDYFDVRLGPDGAFRHSVAVEQAKFIYVHSGSVVVDPDGEASVVKAKDLAILGEGTDVVIEGREEGSGFLFLAGVAHGEPIVKGGPFVMNSREEIAQAFDDYQRGTLY
jgi:redox-sensitive bicupin YhaK (pirin superfamily)